MRDKIKWHEYVQTDALHTPDGQFQHWVLYKESEHLFGSGNRGQLEGGAQDMVVPDTGRVGG